MDKWISSVDAGRKYYDLAVVLQKQLDIAQLALKEIASFDITNDDDTLAGHARVALEQIAIVNVSEVMSLKDALDKGHFYEDRG